MSFHLFFYMMTTLKMILLCAVYCYFGVIFCYCCYFMLARNNSAPFPLFSDCPIRLLVWQSRSLTCCAPDSLSLGVRTHRRRLQDWGQEGESLVGFQRNRNEVCIFLTERYRAATGMTQKERKLMCLVCFTCIFQFMSSRCWQYINVYLFLSHYLPLMRMFVLCKRWIYFNNFDLWVSKIRWLLVI